MLWSRTLRMGERSRRRSRGSRVWRTGHRRSGSTGVSLLVARGSTGRIWMKISAWRVSWRVADLARLRSLFAGGSSGGNPKRAIISCATLSTPQSSVPKPDGALTITFPDFPEAITIGTNRADALEQAADCLQEAIAGRMVRKESSPPASYSTARRYVGRQGEVDLVFAWEARAAGVGHWDATSATTACTFKPWVEKSKLAPLVL
jgi:hypothetical protein